MNYPKVNFLNKELFHLKYKRKAKEWTLDQIHELYLRAKERSEIRQKSLSNYITKIIKEIPEDKSGVRIIYVQEENRLYQYEFSYMNSWNCYGYSWNSVKDETLEDKLTFLIKSEKALEMGQKFQELKDMTSTLHHTVLYILEKLINDKLKNRFNKEIIKSDQIFIIKIGNKKYYVQSNDRSTPSYYDFKIRGEVNDEIVLK